jgi:predicted PurR-regulated permease PerM/methylmalonyl-CoA mutase cobalamin-binding subunit
MSSDWQRSLVNLAATILTVVTVAVLYWAKAIFIPVALAIFLAFVLYPPVMWLQHRGLGRTLAVLVMVGAVVLAVVGIGIGVTHQIVALADTLPDRKDAIKAKVAAARTWVVGDGSSRFGQLIDDVGEVINPKPANQQAVVVEPPSPGLASRLDQYMSPVAEMLGQGAFTFVLTVFILIRREDLRNRMIRLMGDGKVTTTTRAVDDATRRISRYLLVQLMINTGFGLLIALGLFVLGVDYALLWGFIATLMRYVPYIGTWIGLIPPVLFSFATAPDWGGGWGQPMAVLALFIGLELVCNNVLEPWLYGSSMGLSEVAQLVAAGFWAFLWGPIGLVLSGPLTACLLVLGKHVRRFQFLDVLLGDTPALEPHLAFYQRLAARDQDEAADIALEIAGKDGPDAALETVIVPALCLARRDLDDGDLDPADFQVAIRSAREVADEVAERREVVAVQSDLERIRVLIAPTRDEAEHVAADILAGALDPARWETRVTGDETLASELIAAIQEFHPAVVVLAALPPGGLSHCRYLVSRMRAKSPEVRVIVGRWGTVEPNSIDQADNKVKGADGIDYTVSDTRKRLAELHPILVSERGPQGKPSARRTPVGTAGA